MKTIETSKVEVTARYKLAVLNYVQGENIVIHLDAGAGQGISIDLNPEQAIQFKESLEQAIKEQKGRQPGDISNLKPHLHIS